jgi:hypothetical protein
MPLLHFSSDRAGLSKDRLKKKKQTGCITLTTQINIGNYWLPCDVILTITYNEIEKPYTQSPLGL